ncbi:hypothetical protein [Mucilaginibacter sp.]
MKTLAQAIWPLQNTNSCFFIILLVAFTAGLHGLIVLYKLKTREKDIKMNDRLLLAIFNVVISLASICVVLVMMQVNANYVIKHAGELFAQIK